MTGSDALMGDVMIDGHWVQEELDYINMLELQAIILACSPCIRIRLAPIYGSDWRMPLQ